MCIRDRSNIEPSVPVALEQIIFKCTQKRPNQRYSSCADLIKDLRHALVAPNERFVHFVQLEAVSYTHLAVSAEEKLANQWIWQVQLLINKRFCDIIKIIGPSDAPIARLKDMWRKHLYIRSSDHKAYLEAMELIQEITEQAAVQKVSIFVTVC